mmetsp:Transcript_26530/g.52847  ORF Transcript_26530/g.52847 Transcript_26530/m.52847 type:complete len:98 (-) Transcript_26530:5-298(-)
MTRRFRSVSGRFRWKITLERCPPRGKAAGMVRVVRLIVVIAGPGVREERLRLYVIRSGLVVARVDLEKSASKVHDLLERIIGATLELRCSGMKDWAL